MKKIEFLHPFDHDHVLYDRGVHEVPDNVAEAALKHKYLARLADPDAKLTGTATQGEIPPPLQETQLANIEQLLREQRAGASPAPTASVTQSAQAERPSDNPNLAPRYAGPAKATGGKKK
jgi:hypothetical protein